jgi:hypothetical protein
MVLSIQVNSETESRLRAQASAAGKDLAAYVAELVEQAATTKPLDEMLAPLRRQFSDSGTSDEQLVDEIVAAQQAHRADKRKTA